MKKFTTFLVITALLISGIGIFSQAEAQTQTIASKAAAEKIAADAGGTFISGSTTPVLTGTQVALPVTKTTGEVIGFVVAEKANLVTALSEAGLTQVSAAVATTAAGTVAGTTVAAGVALGTTATIALVAATVIGVGLVAASNDDDDTTTAHHATPGHP